MKEQARSFLAIVLPLDLAVSINKKVRSYVGEELAKQMRWIPPQKYHLTLKFLGNAPHPVLRQLMCELHLSLKKWRSFHAMTGACRLLPSKAQSRCITLDIHSGGRLDQLHRQILQSSNQLGLEVLSNTFRPYITIAQTAEKNRLITLPVWGLPGFKLVIKELCLVKSELCKEGARYQVMQRIIFTTSEMTAISSSA